MQSRKPKTSKVGNKKSSPKSDKSSTSTPRFKKETEGKDTFSYLRKTNESATKDRKKSSKHKSNSFGNSFGKNSGDVMERANKRPSKGRVFDKPDRYKSEKRTNRRPDFDAKPTEERKENTLKPWQRRGNADSRPNSSKSFDIPRNEESTSRPWEKSEKAANKNSYDSPSFSRKRESSTDHVSNPRFKSYEKPKKIQSVPSDESLGIRLNRFIANCGVCARREADNLIQQGEIFVNGKVMSDFSYRVQTTDTVRYGSKVLKREKYVYVLLNKPKDFLTTTDDPEGRKSVMDLVRNATTARIYPVGRLDRNTTGLLLLTNDGELTDKLMHPSHKAKKIYQVELDKPFSEVDLQKVRQGIILEDGPMRADDIEIVSPDRKCVGIEIHSGRNRIVRRIFEHLEYKIERLDRVMYAGLTKKDLPRGTWRHLTELEITTLKHLRS